MSDFANLRKARHAKDQLKSYVSRAPDEHDDVVQASPQLAKGGGLPNKLAAASNGLYAAWPTSERLERHGLFLIEDAQTMFLWVGRDAVPQLIMDVFNLPGYDVFF